MYVSYHVKYLFIQGDSVRAEDMSNGPDVAFHLALPVPLLRRTL